MTHVGEKAIEFSVPDQNGEVHTLDNYKGKWLVLYFYPKDNTSGCTIEANDFSSLKDKFEEAHCVVVGVSPDNEKSHCKFIDKFELNFTLLADTNRELIEGYGLWIEKSMYGRKYMGVNRTTFLIDPQGVIQKEWTVKKVDGHAQEVLTALTEMH